MVGEQSAEVGCGEGWGESPALVGGDADGLQQGVLLGDFDAFGQTGLAELAREVQEHDEASSKRPPCREHITGQRIGVFTHRRVLGGGQPVRTAARWNRFGREGTISSRPVGWPHRLILDLTETAWIDLPQHTRDAMLTLTERGVRFADGPGDGHPYVVLATAGHEVAVESEDGQLGQPDQGGVSGTEVVERSRCDRATSSRTSAVRPS